MPRGDPRAHGAEVTATLEDPTSINLAGVIERMRQSAGPDISDFQSRVTAVEASIHEAVLGGNQFGTALSEEDTPPAHQPEPAAALEPYNPGMLPGWARTASTAESAHQDTRIDRYGALFKNAAVEDRRYRTPDADALYQPSQSMRERLLNKPAGSSILKR